jgi:Zn finger protein HypA/HybF involved in hydrogenase expression
MKLKLVSCGICEHWHAPRAHSGHCPVCGTTRLVIHNREFFINWSTEREVIKSGWPVILKRLINVAAQ